MGSGSEIALLTRISAEQWADTVGKSFSASNAEIRGASMGPTLARGRDGQTDPSGHLYRCPRE
jgi:hypothetical protein